MSANPASLPAFPYGAVYFRKSNPPREDWARDYVTAREDGMDVFRHWFMWSAIEVAPGVFDWEEYDAQLELAAQNGMKTIIAEMTTAAPEWAYRRYPEARLETVEGRRLSGAMGASSATGGFHGMCLDNAGLRAAAEVWLTALASRYRGHAGLGGYDIWNECNAASNVCYCEATQACFRKWLERRYGDLEALGRAWRRYSFAEWDDVAAPRELGPYPDSLDWIEFRIDNAYELMDWRSRVIRRADPEAHIVAHGIAASLTRMAPGCADDWRAAEKVEVYGYTWGSSRHGDEPWKQVHAVDLVRAASRGKPFWHAEAYAGPLWMQPQVIGKPRNEGRIAAPEDIRYWDLVSFMCGARGLMYLRWRPLLDGPLFGAFGAYGMDGSRTERSKMVCEIASWVKAPEQHALWRSSPIPGDVGIVYVPETQIFLYAQQGSTDFYAKSLEGAYRGFLANNIQADWVHIDHIAEHDVLYLPIPVMLSEKTAQRLIEWVRRGGTLISEGCPGYFGDGGRVGTCQPNLGLDGLFGARESYVEFTPDLLDGLELTVRGAPARGGIFLQSYELTTGTAAGSYSDGMVAAVENSFGSGRTLLVGTMIGYGFGQGREAGSASLFSRFLSYADKRPAVRCDNPMIMARLHTGEGGTYLWVANPTRQPASAAVAIDERFGSFSRIRKLRSATGEIGGHDNVASLRIPGRDVGVYELT